MPSVFISYRRKPSAILAQLILKDLKEQGIEVYLDIERMENAGNFPTRLFQAIEASDVFVCLLGEGTLESEWVQYEIEHAQKLKKPMIPVFQETFTPLPLEQAPNQAIKTLLEHDGVYIFDVKNVYVPQAVEALARMIENTAAWLMASTPNTPPPQPILSINIETLAGQKFGQYEVKDLLGLGGMSAVYRAYQESLMRDVALKVLPPSFASQPASVERFLREARTSAALEHAHIVPVYDYGNVGGLSFVVMRLLSGGSLAERLALTNETDWPLPSLGETVYILKRLAAALDYAHSRGVIHRDIKANNIMFDDQGSPFIVDFGIAKLTHAVNALTGTGVAMGTPLYMAPEQWRGESVTPATDQYAMGVVAYAAITGHLPFEAPTPYALMHKHINEEPLPPQVWRADLPESVKGVLDQAMAKNPRDRFPSVKDFAAAFESAIADLDEPRTDFFIRPLPAKTVPEVSPLVGGEISPSKSGLLTGTKPPVTLTPPETGGAASGFGVVESPPGGTPPALDQAQLLPVTPSGTPLPHPVINPGATPPPSPLTPIADSGHAERGADHPLTNPDVTQMSATPPPVPEPVSEAVMPTADAPILPPLDQAQAIPTPVTPYEGVTITSKQTLPMMPPGSGSSSRPHRRNIMPYIVAIAIIVLLGAGLLIISNQIQQQTDLQATQAAALAAIMEATATPSATPSPTATFTFTATFTYTASYTPSNTPSPTPATPIAQAVEDVVARLGPGPDYPIIATIEANDRRDLLGISADGAWYQIILRDGNRGWIVSANTLVTVYGDIQVVKIAPPPTETPTETPSPTLTATLTATQTATPTENATRTPQPSRTPRPTATREPVPTRTPRPTSSP